MFDRDQGRQQNNGDLNLASAGLAVNQAIAVGSGTVRLVDAGAISQTAPGTITAGSLSVSDTTGNVVLELANTVGPVAAGTVALSLTGSGEAYSFNNGATGLIVGTVAAAAAGADPLGLFPIVIGATTNNGDLNLASAGLAVNQAIAVGTGTVRLVDTGAISQTAPGTIMAGSLSVSDTTGNVVLELANAVGPVAAGTVALDLTRSGEAFSFNNGATARSSARSPAATAGAGPAGVVPDRDRGDDE